MHHQREINGIKFTRDQQASRSNELLNDRLKHISFSLDEFQTRLENLIDVNYNEDEDRKLKPSSKQPRPAIWYLLSRFCLKRRWNSNGGKPIGYNDFGDLIFSERYEEELRNGFGILREVKSGTQYKKVSSFKKTFMQFNCY